MQRLLAALLLLLTLGWPAAAPAQQQDFLDQMTMTLAIDPGEAVRQSDGQIARLGAAGISGDSLPLAEAYWVRAQAKFRLGDADGARAALGNAREVRPAGQGGQRISGYIDLLSGLLARDNGQIGRSLQLFRSAQRSFIAAGDRRGHALALQSVGILYNDVGDGQNAIRMFVLAEETFPSPDEVFALSLNNNLGIAHQALGDYAVATAHLQQALSIASRLHMTGVANKIRINIARSDMAAGNLTSATQSLADLGDIRSQLTIDQRRDAWSILAKVALRQGRLIAARALIDRAVDGLDPSTSTGEVARRVHFTAYEIMRAQGDRASALTQLEAVRRIDAQDAQIAASNRAALLSAQFQLAAQNTRIVELKARNLQREVGFQRTITIVVILAGLVTLGLLGGLLVTAIRARNRARRDGAELAVSHDRLERALAAKTEFLASTSHELRTPLNGILGMTQIMLADSRLAPGTRSQIELVHDAGSTMRALVDDILDVAKIEHGGFTIAPAPTDVPALIDRVTRLFADKAKGDGLTLTSRCALPDELLMVDAGRLTQILFNLVGNAIKFTRQGSIAVAAELIDGDDAPPRLQLSVRDTGIGIDPASHEAVFEMFHQIDGTRTRSYGGTGLGLAICRQLARAMGGDIRLDSRLGDGSCFTIDIPWIGRPRPADAATEAADPHDAAQITVVSADPMRAAMLAAIVRRIGQGAMVVDTRAALADVLGDHRLTLLVDRAASDFAVPLIEGAEGACRRTILAGNEAGVGEWSQPSLSAMRVVPFSRAAIEQALRETDLPSPANSLNSDLCCARATAMGGRIRVIENQDVSPAAGLE